MKKILEILMCMTLIFLLAFSFSGCTSIKMTEENITATVEEVEQALREFNTEELEKHVDSSTLSYIMKYGESHQQFIELGKAIFADLDMKIVDMDIETGVVTLKVTNKDLWAVAYRFARNLKAEHSTIALVGLLNNDDFLNDSLGTLSENINAAEFTAETEVKVKVTPVKKNLVISFDQEAENAVSGGALSAITDIYN